MRISDWSSDVCSSDLKLLDIGQQGDDIVLVTRRHGHGNGGRIERLGGGPAEILVDRLGHPGGGREVRVAQRQVNRIQRRELETHFTFDDGAVRVTRRGRRSDEHTYELTSLMRIAY